MRVALVQAPVWWTVDAPLGLAQMAGCLAHHGHEPRVFDLNVELSHRRAGGYENLWNWEQFQFWNRPEMVAGFFKDNAAAIEARVLDILRTDAPLIGFSVYSGGQIASLELARMIKREDPSRKIVFGGQYLFLDKNASAAIADPAVDGVIAGPGDEVFPEMAALLESTGALPALPGATVKQDGRTVSGGAPRPLRDLDRVPFADFTGLPLELYDVRNRLPIQASRGCVWACRFCSSQSFWGGYSYMGGDRIFAEIKHHRRLFDWKRHFEFYDITANGDVGALGRLAELAAEDFRVNGSKEYFGWKINAVLRPDMSPGLLKTLMAAGCHDIIYGIESGSPRVRGLMNKPFTDETADRVLKDTHDAGIVTVGNFMFGFPGETEEDFKMTLDFIRRNRASLDRVYASATFTSLEENSVLGDAPEAFGVRVEPGRAVHNLYWESADGANDYLVRLDRYARFRELAIELGLDAYKGINGSLEEDRLANLAQYYRHKGDIPAAIENLEAYLKLDPESKPMRAQLDECRESLAAEVR